MPRGVKGSGPYSRYKNVVKDGKKLKGPVIENSVTTLRVKFTGPSIFDAHQALEAVQEEFEVTEVNFTFKVEAKDAFEAGRTLGKKEAEIENLFDKLERV
jgi:hypothetical protein